jgi:hypothetical protein
MPSGLRLYRLSLRAAARLSASPMHAAQMMETARLSFRHHPTRSLADGIAEVASFLSYACLARQRGDRGVGGGATPTTSPPRETNDLVAWVAAGGVAPRHGTSAVDVEAWAAVVSACVKRAPAARAAPASVAGAPVLAAFCTTCGGKFAAHHRFCGRCGTARERMG